MKKYITPKDLSNFELDVYAAKICPYCKSKTKLVSEEFIYKRNYNNKSIVCCVNYPHCDAYVGTHKDGSPLGRLAKKDLRLVRKDTHELFDRLWKFGHMKRDDAYDELSDFLGLDPELTHIGYFGKETLEKVKRWAIDKHMQLNPHFK